MMVNEMETLHHREDVPKADLRAMAGVMVMEEEDRNSLFEKETIMKRKMLLSLSISLVVYMAACQTPPPANVESAPVTDATPQTQQTAAPAASGEVQVEAEVWADNWFAFYLEDQLVKEDSVPITTERSFNSETFAFNASYPMTLNFIARDFKENDTGLEYIGTQRQQMGDGGFIAQFTNAQTGEIIAVTDSNWSCMVIHIAPLDKACEREANPVAGTMPCGFTSLEEPTGWMDANYNDASWSGATVYTAQQVGPKEGYDQINWDPSAQFIWGSDLETDNTILCKLTVNP